jgi:hypothetical protein
VVVIGFCFTRLKELNMVDAAVAEAPVGIHTAPNGEKANKVVVNMIKQGKARHHHVFWWDITSFFARTSPRFHAT